MPSCAHRTRSRRVALATALAACGLTALALAQGAGTAPPQAPPAADAAARPAVALEVRAIGFDNARGHAIAKLYRPGDNVLGATSFQRATSAIEGRAARLQFGDLAEGTYALVVFHDENDNGIVDHNALGLPKEQLGFSGGFRLGLFSGLPNFKKLAFTLARGPGPVPQVLSIEVR